MKGDILLQNVQVLGFVPATAGKNAKEGKRKVRDAVETKLGKNIDNVRKRCEGKPLSVNVVFYLKKDSVHAKRDLDGLANVLLDVLSKEMSSKDADPGLNIIGDENTIYRIVFEKKMVNSPEEEGLVFSIYEWSYT